MFFSYFSFPTKIISMPPTLPPSSQQRSSGNHRSRHWINSPHDSDVDDSNIDTPSNHGGACTTSPHLQSQAQSQHNTETWSYGRSNRNANTAHVTKLVRFCKAAGISISEPAHRIFVGLNTAMEFLQRWTDKERISPLRKATWQPRDDDTTSYRVSDMTDIPKLEPFAGQHRKLAFMKFADETEWNEKLFGTVNIYN